MCIDSMSSFFELQSAGFRRNYMKTLITLAFSDGFLDNRERDLLFMIGKKRGLSVWQVEDLIKERGEHPVFLPKSAVNKMRLLYDLLQIIYADGIVQENEKLYLDRVVLAFGFPPNLTYNLLNLFRSGIPSKEEWREFMNQLPAVQN